MDPALLIDPTFWSNPEPFSPGGFESGIPDIPELAGHVLFQTSGSTGKPKWIALSKNALLLSAACVNRHLEVTEDSCWGLPLPPHHVGGFGVMARVFEAASDYAVFAQRWNPGAFHTWLQASGVTHTSLVPTQVHDLVQAGLAAPSALKAIVVGGGRLDVTTGQKARDLGWPVLASYGMTEACSQIATQPLELLEKPYQTGTLPLLPIWNARTTEGDLLEISGPALFTGMLVHDDDRWNYVPRTNEWHRTADRVLLEGDKITPLGRADTHVKILGELVDIEAIEAEMISLSGGRISTGDFAIAALPDARAEHRLVPVFAQSANRDAVMETLHAYQEKAEGLKRLQPPVFVNALPRSPLGKLLRVELGKLVET